MIHVNTKNVIGNRSFAEGVFAQIKPTLEKNFDKEMVGDFENELNFFGFIALQYLEPKDFNVVANAILKANINSPYTAKLVDMFQADPRYTP